MAGLVKLYATNIGGTAPVFSNSTGNGSENIVFVVGAGQPATVSGVATTLFEITASVASGVLGMQSFIETDVSNLSQGGYVTLIYVNDNPTVLYAPPVHTANVGSSHFTTNALNQAAPVNPVLPVMPTDGGTVVNEALVVSKLIGVGVDALHISTAGEFYAAQLSVTRNLRTSAGTAADMNTTTAGSMYTGLQGDNQIGGASVGVFSLAPTRTSTDVYLEVNPSILPSGHPANWNELLTRLFAALNTGDIDYGLDTGLLYDFHGVMEIRNGQSWLVVNAVQPSIEANPNL